MEDMDVGKEIRIFCGEVCFQGLRETEQVLPTGN